MRTVPANEPHIAYEGRVVRDSSRVRFGYPGVTVHLSTDSSKIGVQLKVSGDASFDLSVDGAPHQEIVVREGRHRLLLAEALNRRESRIKLVRRTESWLGTCEIESFELDSEGGLLPVTLPQRKLLFIGDSITCGEGAGTDLPLEKADPSRWNARLSYGKLLASRFSAQSHLVSYGGRGVIRDWQGNRDTANAPVFYERSMPDDSGHTWDPSLYRPDAVVVCLGQNDFNPGVPDRHEFVSAYLRFVARILGDSPDAMLFLVGSPMLLDETGKEPKKRIASDYLDQVVAESGTSRVRHIRLPHFPGSEHDAHPTAESHAGIASFIAPEIGRPLGWLP